ncbi:PD40 domain-containing protein [Candidatus Saccharibacteria bacterium]|nr:PD40 domain-containing protein [Candidatus Saccharibacteria bacterium]
MIFKRAGLILVSAITLLAFLVANSPIASANSYFGGNGRITFYSPGGFDNTAAEIYTIKPDGTDLKLGDANTISEANPQWAPSGLQIAFDRYVDSTNKHDIFIQNVTADGSFSGPPVVLGGANSDEQDFDPSWSPDSTKIAFHRCTITNGSCVGAYQIQVVDVSSGVVTRITDDPGFQDTEPTWRKDGGYLTFTHEDNTNNIYSIQIATPNTHTANAGLVQIDVGDSSSDLLASPQWSPTENKVVYTKNGNFWVYNQDTNTKRQLTTVGGLSAPTWSPDGKIIATGGANQIRYFSAETGDLVNTTTVASNPGLGFDATAGLIEIDWARAEVPPSTTHECTTSVNQDCTTFTPEIPAACQNITTAATHGTPKYESNAFLFTPEADYVGTDSYVYSYYDENMNTITCTVNITVLPQAPATGITEKNNLLQYGIIAALIVSTGVVIKRRYSPR